ncbi:MAG TPA: ATP-binding protein, partial [Pirellulales bacterium]|nr:ATP-binding protein [Pirellulales bacterium]
LNLIGNAIKFTERGGVRVVSGWRDGATAGGELYFEVHDTGIGMTDEQSPRRGNDIRIHDFGREIGCLAVRSRALRSIAGGGCGRT